METTTTTYEIVTEGGGRMGRTNSLFEAKIMARQAARTTGRRAMVFHLATSGGPDRYGETCHYAASPEDR